jgi:hypothetical protein
MGFIFLGLTVVASLMNLLVIRIVAFYSQERLLEKLREEEAASQAVFLKGDVICSSNTNKQRSTSLSNQQQQYQILIHTSQTSVCSCTCMETLSEWRRKRTRWKKQQREEKTKAIKISNSDHFIKVNLATRRSSV